MYEIDELKIILSGETYLKPFFDFLAKVEKLEDSKGNIVIELKEVVRKIRENIRPIIGDKYIKYTIPRLYIPVLRGLRGFGDEKGNTYQERTYQDYFSSLNIKKDYIFTGLDMYERVMEMLLGTSEERKLISQYQKFLSENFFDNDEVVLTPKIDKKVKNDVLFIQIGEDEYPIYHLGDGMQSLLIMTFPLFFSPKNTVFFIEEPEIFLHPGLQRKLLEVLISFDPSKNFQFFITTHSNHFLDMTLDFDSISIFKFTNINKKEYFCIENIDVENNSVLEILGVKDSSVFLSNCTIWVEGITDRIYIRKYLQLYQQEKMEENEKVFKEDIHFSFVEYSGNNIAHWSFLEGDTPEDNFRKIDFRKISKKIFLVADNDDEKKQKRHEMLLSNLGESNYSRLKVREIENLVSKDILLSIVSQYEKVPTKDLKLKIENLNEENYSSQPLGKFIEEELLEEPTRKYFNPTGTGTLKDKMVFCEKVIKHIDDENFKLENLHPEVKILCEEIYNFIKLNNS